MKHVVFIISSIIFTILIASNVLALSIKKPIPCENSSSYWHECHGTRIFENGDKYVGDFRENTENGWGTYSFSNGDQYYGVFEGGKINYQGTYTYSDGSKTIGDWKNGILNGYAIMTFANGDINKEGIFSNGKFLYAKKLSSIERCDWDKRFNLYRAMAICIITKDDGSIIKY
jgi:hypothetical protein